MPIKKGDLVPNFPNPARELATSFLEVVDVAAADGDSIVKMMQRVEKVAPSVEGGNFLVPASMLRDVKVYRLIDPFADDAVPVDSLREDYDNLGTNPRAWARAMAQQTVEGRLDETTLLGWCSRLIEAGAARERALIPRISAPPKKPRPPSARPLRTRSVKK